MTKNPGSISNLNLERGFCSGTDQEVNSEVNGDNVICGEPKRKHMDLTKGPSMDITMELGCSANDGPNPKK